MGGYIEEILYIDDSFLTQLKKRFDSEIIFFFYEQISASQNEFRFISSNKKLNSHIKESIFLKPFNEFKNSHHLLDFQLFTSSFDKRPYQFFVQPLSWGQKHFFSVLGTIKPEAQRDVNLAFTGLVLVIFIFIFIFSLLISKRILLPISDLIRAIQNMDANKKPVKWFKEQNQNSESSLKALMICLKKSIKHNPS